MTLTQYDERKLRTNALRMRTFWRDISFTTGNEAPLPLGVAWATSRLRRLRFLADQAHSIDGSNYWSLFLRTYDPLGAVHIKEIPNSRGTIEATRTLAVGGMVTIPQTSELDFVVPKGYVLAVVSEETGTASALKGRVQADLLVGGR